MIVSCAKHKETPAYTTIFKYFGKGVSDTTKFYGFKDIDTAIFYAKQEQKKILVIFSGWACSSEPKLEWKTLALYGDNNKIQENFVIAWLPVDDKGCAKDTNQVVFWYGKNRKLKTIGDKNKYWQEQLTQTSSEPLFCFVDTNKKLLSPIMGYETNPNKVKEFINNALKK
jgi:hypothetical protein